MGDGELRIELIDIGAGLPASGNETTTLIVFTNWRVEYNFSAYATCVNFWR